MNLHAIAHDIKVAQDLRMSCSPITTSLPAFDQLAAYEVARLIHEQRLAEGAQPVGRKIGFTNRNIWPEYGVYEPIWAHIYDRTVTRVLGHHGACNLGPFAEPRIEPEIILHFRSAPPVTHDLHAILACIDWIAHGFEIVQSHFPDWQFKVADTIADASLHGTLLIGEPVEAARLGDDLLGRLASFTINLSCGDEVRARGCGANVLDNPLAAVAHLIAKLASQSSSPPIGAGELITTGTLTAALPIRAGERWSTSLEGIGLPAISIDFTA
ncbi:MAG: decarboxylase [Betaproteobacteria bacterium]|nr:decarboxylase [Betaproteobacteria bacterium]